MGFHAGMEDALWDRLSVEVRAMVDSLVSAGRNVHALAVMHEHAGPPTPSLHECVDLLDQRFTVLRQGPTSS